MSTLTQLLQNASPQNLELLHVLSTTDYAAPALSKTIAYIADLESQIQRTDRELSNLHSQTEIERKEHLSYHDSKFKRYAHKVRGSKGEAAFSAKAEKEEREFAAAWQKERDAEKSREELNAALETAKSERATQEADSSEHAAAQTLLDQLYDSIFAGPTPELPDEDRLEDAAKAAKLRLDQTLKVFDAEKAAGQALRRVEERLKIATGAMDDTLHYSRADIVVGGHYADAKKRDALSKCQLAVLESLRHMDEARRQQPAIAASPDVNLDNGHLVSDVLFDNIFSNVAMHDRIKDGDAQLKKAVGHVAGQIGVQLDRAGVAKAELARAMGEEGEARAALRRLRAEAFERVAAGRSGGGGKALPPYEG